MYLFSLRFLLPQQRRCLAQKLKSLTSQQEYIRHWNSALTRLTGAAPERTTRAAKGNGGG